MLLFLFAVCDLGETAMASREAVLAMYRAMLRYGGRFHDYNYREYALRRTREEFRAHATESNPETIKQLMGKAQTYGVVSLV